jgi:hypothetical protein
MNTFLGSGVTGNVHRVSMRYVVKSARNKSCAIDELDKEQRVAEYLEQAGFPYMHHLLLMDKRVSRKEARYEYFNHTEKVRRTYAMNLAYVLDSLLDYGVAHCDPHYANVLVNNTTFKIIDFGYAEFYEDVGEYGWPEKIDDTIFQYICCIKHWYPDWTDIEPKNSCIETYWNAVDFRKKNKLP